MLAPSLRLSKQSSCYSNQKVSQINPNYLPHPRYSQGQLDSHNFFRVKMRFLKAALLAALASFSTTLALTLPEPATGPGPGKAALKKRNAVIKRGLCSPTGPGVCNFGVENVEPTLSDIAQYVYIFDRYCDQIGHVDNPPSLPYNLYSQLRYTVVITALDRSFSPHIAFRYGAGNIDSNRGQCACGGCSSGLAACVECQCAFNC